MSLKMPKPKVLLSISIISMIFVYYIYTFENKTRGKLVAKILNLKQQDFQVSDKSELSREQTLLAPFQTIQSKPLTTTKPLIKKYDVCRPHLHFAYVKTHKTGSSTVQRIFNKHISKHKLKWIDTIFIPFSVGYPGRIQEEFLFLRENNKFRLASKGEDFVIANHFRFNHAVLKEMMPNDTLFISVMREPWQNFQSAFYYYYNPQNHFDRRNMLNVNCGLYPYIHVAKGRTISFQDYLEVFDSLDGSVPWFFRSKNYQSHDLGLDPLLDNDVEIEKAVRQLGSQIDLMMITDYMDESMILLKDLLCLSWPDIVFTDTGSSHSYTPITLDENTTIMKRFNNYYKLDIASYKYFNETFWKKVDAYGRENMRKDVEKLRTFRRDQQTRKKQDVQRSIDTYKNVILAEEEMKKIKAFEEIGKDYSDERLTRILKEKIRKDKRLNEKLVNEITESMIQNNGGCPAEP